MVIASMKYEVSFKENHGKDSIIVLQIQYFVKMRMCKLYDGCNKELKCHVQEYYYLDIMWTVIKRKLQIKNFMKMSHFFLTTLWQ